MQQREREDERGIRMIAAVAGAERRESGIERPTDGWMEAARDHVRA